ncbi:unnamed protein product [Rotaria sp. Silwood1]|nr:unnamed protein product [Rotaria sp. Silwood1]CAF1650124.1 unnamed protein product [Rotaria sp. Silwood1]CAF3777046.1 unnamed protein product [Rotaria sp. Silwood1]CAF3805556.1 unnamed protein product [Rotaria sp. Silwood1]CAF4753105.1 unnamed protein product [Rotaria sp. Silwood1]
MQRYSSKASFADSTTSSCITKANHTHVIMQTNADNNSDSKYIVLPVKNLVNFGRPLKSNDLVTYKIDLKCRGTNRGKILLFGSEEDCAQQVQIFSTIGDENDASICDRDETNNPSELQENEQELNNHADDEDFHQRQSTTKQDLSKHESNKNQNIHKKLLNKNNNSTTKAGSHSIEKVPKQTSVQRATTASMLTMKIPASQPDKNQKTLDHMLKKVIVGTSSTCNSTITIGTSTKTPSTINSNKCTPKNIRTQQGSLTSLQTLTTNSNKKRKLSHEGDACSNGDDQHKDDNDKHQMDIDLVDEDEEYFVKEFNKKKTIPGDEGRQWLIHVVKILSPHSPGLNTDKIARALKIKKSSLLTSCIRETATNTTRQVIKLLYTPAQLAKGHGNVVSRQKRKLIKAFVEQEHGSIEHRPFCEAINGVFRSYAHKLKKQMSLINGENSNLIEGQQGESPMNNINDEEGSRSSNCEQQQQQEEKDDEEEGVDEDNDDEEEDFDDEELTDDENDKF